MKFTTKKPRKPGWYWARDAREHSFKPQPDMIVMATAGANGLLVSWLMGEPPNIESMTMHLSEMDDRMLWAGPLEGPK